MPARRDPCLTAELATQLRAQARHQPTLRIAFIVTLQPGAIARAVMPVAPTLEVELIRMAAGRMTAAQALQLADDTRVERIELDGEAHALPADEEPND